MINKKCNIDLSNYWSIVITILSIISFQWLLSAQWFSSIFVVVVDVQIVVISIVISILSIVRFQGCLMKFAR